MGSEAPSWADQWGSSAGRDDDNGHPETKDGGKKTMANTKALASASFGKAKATAVVGAQKVKSGASMGINWVKTHCQKRSSK